MAKQLLIIVDYQRDFVADDGILTAGEAARAVGPWLDARAGEVLAGGGDVVFTMDTHDAATWPDHPEHAAFPIHCVKGTPGWEIYGGVARHLAHPNARTVEKRAYCPPFAPVERWVREYDAIELAGVVTNICVLHTAVGLYTAKVEANSPVRLTVREEGCASFDPAAAAFALDHMKKTLGMAP